MTERCLILGSAWRHDRKEELGGMTKKKRGDPRDLPDGKPNDDRRKTASLRMIGGALWRMV